MCNWDPRNKNCGGGRCTLSTSQSKSIIRAQRGNPVLYAKTEAVVTTIDQLPSSWVPELGIGPYNSLDNATPTNFYSADGRVAVACQIDCLSKIGVTKVFNNCEKRFYKYGALADSQGCFFPESVSDDQAVLVRQICLKINKCDRTTFTFSRANLLKMKGINVFAKPFGGGGGSRR